MLGGTYLQNYLTMGVLGKGFCALTDKRVYFKGKCYTSNGGRFRSTKEQRTVDVNDITGTGFIKVHLLWMLITAIILSIPLVWGFIIIFLEDYYHYDGDGFRFGDAYSTVLLVLLLLGVIGVWVWYILKSRPKVFEIEYAGGRIAFPTSAYSPNEIQNFQNALRRAKDNYVATQPNTENTASNISNAEELMKYKQLLDAGVISKEEFESAKARLL